MAAKREYLQSRICDGFAEDKLCFGAYERFYFLIRHIRIEEIADNAEAAKCDTEKVYGSAVYLGGDKYPVPRGNDVHNRKQRCRLPGNGAERGDTVFDIGDLFFHKLNRGVGNAGIHMPFGGQIEKLADLFRRGIGICGGLIYRQCERFAVARLISGTDTFGCLRDVFLHVRGILRYIYSYLPSYARSLLTALSQLPG